jgi:two-component system, OmpR family, response regulator
MTPVPLESGAVSEPVVALSSNDSDASALLLPPSKTNGAGRLRRILLVDDDPGIRTLVGTLLRGEGFVVEEAGSGSAALDAILREPPDALITDVNMPGGSGEELLGSLEAAGWAHVPTLVVSAQLCPAVLRNDRFLLKPFDLEELVSAVWELVLCTKRGSPLIPT